MGRVGRVNTAVGTKDIENIGGSYLPPGMHGDGTYDTRLNIYGLHGAVFRKWRTALARSQTNTGHATILTIGDSITLGYPSPGDYRLSAWPELLRKRLATKYGNAGTGMLYMNLDGTDSRLVVTGTWAGVAAGYGAFGVCGLVSSSNTSYISFLPEENVDSFSFWCWVPTTSAAQVVAWSIDGGSESVIDVLADSNSALGVVKKFIVPAGMSGLHTLKLRVSSGTVNLWAIEGTNGSTGIRVTRLAKGGQQAEILASTANGNGGSMSAAFLSSPDLTIIAFGHNEYLSYPTVTNTDTFRTNMLALITQAKLTGDVILQTQIPNSNVNGNPSQTAYNQIVYDLADSNDCAVWDVYERWGSYVAMPSIMYADATHPSPQGYADMASHYYGALPLGI